MLWIKAFHIISVITWFSALFYLPRLFVYHAMSSDKISSERFIIMQRKLYRGIMTPSMVLSIGFGSWLMIENWVIYTTQYWLYAKLGLVFVLLGYHFYCGHLMRAFASNQNRKTHVFYRWLNEFPVLILVAVVILVVVKPF
jgi:putative membrane protein